MDDFVLRALVGVVILAAMLGPLGAFVVWRQMAYFGDTIAHSALLGIAISLMSGGLVPMPIAMLAVALTVALTLSRFLKGGRFQADTLLGLLAHSALALGVLLVASMQTVRVDLSAYLFGDILTIGWVDVAVLACLAAAVGVTLYRNWRSLLMATIDPGIAAVEGVNPARMHLVLTVLLAAVIALSIKLTGVLLITALLIIPAAAARYLARSPQQMAVLASAIGIAATSGGLGLSLLTDTPTGPMMVVTAGALFVLTSVVAARR